MDILNTLQVKSFEKVLGFMIWSTVKGAFMLQSSEIFVSSGLLFPPSYILPGKKFVLKMLKIVVTDRI